VTLGAGEMYVVPKGVEHITRASRERHVLVVEPRGVVNTGDAGGALTAQNDVWASPTREAASSAAGMRRLRYGENEQRIRGGQDMVAQRLTPILKGAQGGRGKSPFNMTFGPQSDESAEKAVWMSIWVDDVDAVHRRCLEHGLEVTWPPTDMRWNTREMHVRHPDGHVFRVSRGIGEDE
jgi:glyoxalase/bleomycin resistance protein/dioxygenase superfamily protein